MARSYRSFPIVGPCVCCGAKRKLTRDHIVPLAKGGAEHDQENIQTLCARCNQSKADGDVCRIDHMSDSPEPYDFTSRAGPYERYVDEGSN